MANQNVPSINVSGLFEIIFTTGELKKRGIVQPAIDLLGEAGIGKSESVIAAGKKYGIYKDNIHVINLGEIGDPAEMLGYPQTAVKVLFKPVAIKGEFQVTKSVEEIFVNTRFGTFSTDIVEEKGKRVCKWSFMPNNLFKGSVKIDVFKELSEEDGMTDYLTTLNVTGAPVEQYVNKELIPHIEKDDVQRIDYATNALIYAPPSWVIAIKEAFARGEQTMLVLDDYTRATPTILAAVMELINKGTYGSWELPYDCIIVLTSNPDNGSYDVTGQDGAGRSRKSQYEVRFNAREWGVWCYENRDTVDERVIDWLLLNKELLSNESIASAAKSEDLAILNARSATNAARSIIGIPTEKEDLIYSRVASCVGTTNAASFKAFLNQKFDLPKMEDIFSKISHAAAFKNLQEGSLVTDKNGGKVNSVAAEMVLTVRLLGYVKTLEKIDKHIIDRLEYLLTNKVNDNGVLKAENIIYLITKLSHEGRLSRLTRRPSITRVITNSH